MTCRGWVVFACLCVASISGNYYTIGYLPNVKGKTILRKGSIVSGAITYAIDVVNKSKLLKEYNLTLLYNDTKGDTLIGTKALIEQWRKGAIAFIGPEDSCEVEATVAASLNLPMISHKCSDAVRSKENNFKTFIRTHAAPTKVVKSIIALLKYYKWTKFTIIAGKDLIFQAIADSLEREAIGVNFHLNSRVSIPSTYEICDEQDCCFESIKNAVKETYLTTRVYVFLGSVLDLYTLLKEVQMKKLLDNGEYAVVYVDLEMYNVSLSHKYILSSREITEDEVHFAISAVQSLLVIVATPPGDGYDDFVRNVTHFNQKEPFCLPSNVDQMLKASLVAFSLYDAVILYSEALAEVLEENSDPRNGTNIVNKIIARQEYQSIGGSMMRIDKNGDVEGNYTVLSRHKSPLNTTFESMLNLSHTMLPVGRFYYTANSTQLEFKLDRSIDWINGKPPLEEPPCSYNGSLCKTLPSKTREITAGLLGSMLVSACLVTSIIYRNWKYEQEIAGLLWRITLDEMQRTNSEGNLSSTSKTNLSQMSMESRATHQIFTQTARYRGMLVAVKHFRLSRKNMDISRKLKKEMKIMRELRNDNINPFIGACIQPYLIYVVTEYCSKGSIQDVLENDDLKLDEMFIASLVSDLIKGMIYLHESELKIHGNLKSSNCLITSRWVLQVAGFGLYELRNSGENNDNKTEHEHFKNLLWKAPELIRENHPLPNISQKVDVYSFGIILHEIIRRQGPFGNIPLSPKEIVEKVMKEPSPVEEPFRPSIVDIGCEDYIIHVMQDCWAEKQESRPDFLTIKERLKRMRKGMKSNIVNNMMEMMEKYANNLEELVDERTCLLVEEKKKTESLLHRMLPKSVATQLIKGEVVVPEMFDAVTIYFSDIVGFTEMSAVSTPMEVVTFLNDLYTVFDAIIGHYDVYKVETIGDAYMVVSGLPIRNGNNHASEIACMALELLDAVKAFKIRHRPNQLLKLRVGIHTGPVVAGVVGLTMPRYCLFGDTVNTASRMESHGEALKIHISPQCKLYLQKLGGYVTEERGLIKMKGKGVVSTYWLVGHSNNKQHKVLSHDVILPQPLFASVRNTEAKKWSPKLDNNRRGSSGVRTDMYQLGDLTSINSSSMCSKNSVQNRERTCNAQTNDEIELVGDEEQREEIKVMKNGIKKINLSGNETGIPLLPSSYVTNQCHENRSSRFRFPRKNWHSLDELQKPKPRVITWFTKLFEPRLEEHDRRRSSNKFSNYSENAV